MRLTIAGAILGDPQGAYFMIADFSPRALMHAENSSGSASKLAVSLLIGLFTHSELATGNCTKAQREDIQLLDQTKINAIRGKYIHVPCVIH